MDRFVKAISLIFVAGILFSCSKETPAEEETFQCQFCANFFDTEEEYWKHIATCEDVEIPDDPESYNNADGFTSWFANLDDDVKLIDMTIPGLHDAATWAYNKNSIVARGFKDQVYHYTQAFVKGARAFDLRIGYDDMLLFGGSFINYCRFFHGDKKPMAFLRWSQLDRIDTEIMLFFPIRQMLENDFMILFVQWEYPSGSGWKKTSSMNLWGNWLINMVNPVSLPIIRI